MSSSIEQKQELQKKLQQLREKRVREQAAFNIIASANPELSADEIERLAKAEADEALQSMEAYGETICLGDSIKVHDDGALLTRADRGHFAGDFLKKVYLGERGEIVAVMPNFEGKSAVEMRFADGIRKIFFCECLDLGPAATKLQLAEAKEKDTHRAALLSAFPTRPEVRKAPTALADETGDVNAANLPPPPSWGDIMMPHRRDHRGSNSAPGPLTPPPPATVDQLPPPLKNAPKPVNSEGNVASPSAPAKVCASSNGNHEGDSLNSPVATSKKVPPSTLSKVAPSDTGADNLLGTPRHGDALPSAPRHTDSSKALTAVQGSGVPTKCSKAYRAKYSLQDSTSNIPRKPDGKPTGIRKCYVAAYLPSSKAPLKYCPLTFQAGVETLEAVLPAVSRALGWATKGTLARRLFSTRGDELTAPDAIVEGMRLIATTGAAYAPRTGEEKLSLSSAVSPVATSKKRSASPVVAPGTSAASPKQAVVGKSRKAAALPKPAVQTPAQQKTMHIRVYENGMYDDNIFRTVTVRPTYKTLASLKSIICRELQWRDGRKVDILFDASGMEIENLSELFDGECVVASAGDRFVIPYPTTVLHQEAMKLSDRL